MTAEKALEQRHRIRELERTAGITLLHGTELNIQPDGSLDWDENFLAGFDIVVASVHSAFRQSRDTMTARILRAVAHPAVHVIGHREPIDADWDEIFRAAARTSTALEVKSFPDRLDLDGDLVRRARHAGVRFAISTDAHTVLHLDYMLFGVGTAQRDWAGRADVINTWPLASLRRFLAKHPPSHVRAG